MTVASAVAEESLALENIERIDVIPPDEFLARYLARSRPVVIRNLYAGNELAQLATEAQVLERWGDVHMPAQLEYTTRLDRDEPNRWVSLRAYLGMAPDDPLRGKLVVVEHDTPAQMRAAFSLPAYAELGGVSLDDANSKLFVAHAGAYAHLHFDVDGKGVLLTQVFGRKRVMVIPPEASQAIDPLVTERVGNMSSRYVEHLDPQEKRAFVRELGGYDCVIGPGETLFMPAGWWHYVDYLDTSMSINVRMGRTRLQQRLYDVSTALEAKHLHYWQAIIQPFATGKPPSPHAPAAEALVDLLDRARAGGAEEIARFGEALVALFRAIAPTAYRRILHRNDVTRAAPITRIMQPRRTVAVAATEQVWGAESIPVLSPNVEPLVHLDGDAITFLRDNVAEFRFDADADVIDAVRNMLVEIRRGGKTIAALAASLEIDLEDLVGVIRQLGENRLLIDVGRR